MAEEFTKKVNARYYRGFLADLLNLNEKNPTAWLNIRKRMCKNAVYVFLSDSLAESCVLLVTNTACTYFSRAGGGVEMQLDECRASTSAMEAAAAELEGRSGMTDSEGES